MDNAINYVRLTRPANLVTAVSDVLAGICISGYVSQENLDVSKIILLCISTIGLYGGGVVFNDVFDAELDAIERPERAIPSGKVTKFQATIFGIVLLVIGIYTASFNVFSLLLAIAIVISALVYDKYGKHQFYLGPLNMGLCRGLNLLLGISIVTDVIIPYSSLAIIPIIYIATITMVSRGEVYGSRKSILYIASGMYGVVIAGIFTNAAINEAILFTLPFLFLFSWLIFTSLFAAIANPEGKMIGKAVKAGVIALIAMNASWAAAFGEPYMALFILALLPLSMYLGKLFAVT